MKVTFYGAFIDDITIISNVIPRKGEIVILKSMEFEVDKVYYNYDENKLVDVFIKIKI